jgi:hypothetical protein
MNDPTHVSTTQRYSEEQAQEFIKRALALHAERGATLSAEDVDAVMVELDVPSDIRKHILEPSAFIEKVAPINGEVVVESGLLGAGLGVLGALGMPFASDPLIVASAMIGFAVMYAGALFTRVERRSHSIVRGSQIANLFTWLGMGGGYIAMNELTKHLYIGGEVSLQLWVFPLAWVFTSVSGAVLSKYLGNTASSDGPIRGAASRLWRALKNVARPNSRTVT